MRLIRSITGRKLTAPGFRGMGVARAPFFVDFTKMANGVPGPMVGGQPTLRDYSGVGPAFVQSGALVIDSVTATYTGWQLPEDIEWLTTEMSFGKTTDGAALIATPHPSLASVVQTCLHVVITPSNWVAQWGSSAVGSLTTVDSGAFPAFPLDTRCKIGWRVLPTGLQLRLPNGSIVGPINSTALISRTHHSAIIEHYNNNSEVPGIKFFNAAIKCFRNPTAAGRTNLLIAPNDLSNAAWNKFMTGPTGGQLDGEGGTLAQRMMEVSANSFQFNYQSVAKPAEVRRYALRAKMRLVGRDWASILSKQAAFTDIAPQDFNLTTNALGVAQAGLGTERSAMLYPFLQNNMKQVQVDFLSDNANALHVGFGSANADGGNVAGYVGDITKGVDIYDAQLIEYPV